MSYLFYKTTHLVCILILVLSTGLLLSNVYTSGLTDSLRKKLSAVHGTTLLLLFVAGFGLMARGGYSFASGWLWVKVGIWLVFGLLPLLIKRTPQNIRTKLFLVYALLLVLAVYMVLFKPF